MFSQQSTVVNLKTLSLCVQLLSNYQDVTVVQVMHHLHHTWPTDCIHGNVQDGFRMIKIKYLWRTQRCNTFPAALIDTLLQGWCDIRASSPPSAASPLTSTEAVSLHYCAGDVKLFEGCHTQRPLQVTGRPDKSIRSCNCDSWFTGRQHHNDCLDVRDGETCVLPKTPETQTQKKERGEVTGRKITSVTASLLLYLVFLSAALLCLRFQVFLDTSTDHKT